METDYKIFFEQNAIIHAFMGLKPEEEYHVVTIDETGYVLSPKQHGYSWAPEQKAECDRWIRENKRADQYKTTKRLNYPYYNQNWNDLMPVVEKISRHVYAEQPDADGFGATIKYTAYPRTFGMLSPEGKIMVRFNNSTLFEADTLIEATYQAVLDWIQWYNNQQQP